MGMSNGGGPRNTLSEINVTPLVDVMLVLLVVFMVTTPVIVDEMQPNKVEVNVPNVKAAPLDANDKDVATLMVLPSRELKIRFGDVEGSQILPPCPDGAGYTACLDPLTDKLQANKNLQEAGHVLIEADRALPYGFVADVMNRVKQAGITRLGLVTVPSETLTPGGEAP